DLVAFVCVPGTTGPSGDRHRVRIRDAFRIPKPGETEVRVEDSPGVTIHRARVGGADDPSREFKFVGPGGPLADDGLELDYAVSDKTPRVADGACTGASTAANRGGTAWWPLIGGAAVLAGGLGFVALRRRRATAS